MPLCAGVGYDAHGEMRWGILWCGERVEVDRACGVKYIKSTRIFYLMQMLSWNALFDQLTEAVQIDMDVC